MKKTVDNAEISLRMYCCCADNGNLGVLTEQELDAELEKGYKSILVGKTRNAKDVFDDIRKEILER